jgi:DNA-binding NarL/FixJ family response regulator
LDGSGYPRRPPAQLLPLAARILAATETYCTAIEPRPHRDAASANQAAAALRRYVDAGALDARAVDGVLAAAGHVTPRPRIMGLTLSDRELQVLRLIAQGKTNRQMAAALVLSEKTVGHHIERLYNKIGVSTRAAATLHAMQNQLL